MFEEDNFRYGSPFRKKIIKQIIMREQERINRDFEPRDNKHLQKEIREKLGSDYNVEYLDPRIEEMLDGKRNSQYEEAKHRYNEGSQFDLSNKRDIIAHDSTERGRRNKFQRSPRDLEEQLFMKDELIDQQQRDFEEDSLDQNRRFRKNKGYVTKKYLDPDGVEINEEIDEPKTVYLNSRKTQTPIRDTSNQGIQYNGDDVRLPQTIFKNRTSDQASPDVRMKESNLLFSSIRKREQSDSETDNRIFEQTPFKENDLDKILDLIKGNEALQAKIIDDPELRENLYQRFSVLKHSSSDQTLPHSFFSSKHGGDRRTQGDTNIFRTPHRSNEEDKESHRFTQFANSELIGKDGKIYDRGTGVQIVRPEFNNDYQDDTDLHDDIDSHEIPSPSKRSKEFNKKDEKYDETRNFSFRDPNKKVRDNLPRESNTLDMNDADNVLGVDDKPSYSVKEASTQKIKSNTYKENPSGSHRSKISSRKSRIGDSVRRTSEYKRKFNKDGKRFDPLIGQTLLDKISKINIKPKQRESIGSTPNQEEEKSSNLSRYDSRGGIPLPNHSHENVSSSSMQDNTLGMPKQDVSKYLSKKSHEDDEEYQESFHYSDEEAKRVIKSQKGSKSSMSGKSDKVMKSERSERSSKHSINSTSKKMKKGYYTQARESDKFDYPAKKTHPAAPSDPEFDINSREECIVSPQHQDIPSSLKSSKLSDTLKKIKNATGKELLAPKASKARKMQKSKQDKISRVSPQASISDLMSHSESENFSEAKEGKYFTLHSSAKIEEGKMSSKVLPQTNILHSHEEYKKYSKNHKNKREGQKTSNYPSKRSAPEDSALKSHRFSQQVEKIESFSHPENDSEQYSESKVNKVPKKRDTSNYRKTKERFKSQKLKQKQSEKSSQKPSKSSQKPSKSSSDQSQNEERQSQKEELKETPLVDDISSVKSEKEFKAIKSRNYVEKKFSNKEDISSKKRSKPSIGGDKSSSISSNKKYLQSSSSKKSVKDVKPKTKSQKSGDSQKSSQKSSRKSDAKRREKIKNPSMDIQSLELLQEESKGEHKNTQKIQKYLKSEGGEVSEKSLKESNSQEDNPKKALTHSSLKQLVKRTPRSSESGKSEHSKHNENIKDSKSSEHSMHSKHSKKSKQIKKSNQSEESDQDKRKFSQNTPGRKIEQTEEIHKEHEPVHIVHEMIDWQENSEEMNNDFDYIEPNQLIQQPSEKVEPRMDNTPKLPIKVLPDFNDVDEVKEEEEKSQNEDFKQKSETSYDQEELQEGESPSKVFKKTGNKILKESKHLQGDKSNKSDEEDDKFQDDRDIQDYKDNEDSEENKNKQDDQFDQEFQDALLDKEDKRTKDYQNRQEKQDEGDKIGKLDEEDYPAKQDEKDQLEEKFSQEEFSSHRNGPSQDSDEEHKDQKFIHKAPSDSNLDEGSKAIVPQEIAKKPSDSNKLSQQQDQFLEEAKMPVEETEDALRDTHRAHKDFKEVQQLERVSPDDQVSPEDPEAQDNELNDNTDEDAKAEYEKHKHALTKKTHPKDLNAEEVDSENSKSEDATIGGSKFIQDKAGLKKPAGDLFIGQRPEENKSDDEKLENMKLKHVQPIDTESKNVEPKDSQLEYVQPGDAQPRVDQLAFFQPGGIQPGDAQPWDAHPGSVQPEGIQLSGSQLTGVQPEGSQPGSAQPGSAQPGSAQPESSQPGGAHPGKSQPGSVHPGSVQPGSAQPGSVQPEGIQLAGAHPESAQPENALLEGVHLEGVHPKATLPEDTQPADSKLEDYKYEDAKIEGTNFEGAKPEETKHEEAQSKDAQIDNSQPEYAKLKNDKFENAKINDSESGVPESEEFKFGSTKYDETKIDNEKSKDENLEKIESIDSQHDDFEKVDSKHSDSKHSDSKHSDSKHSDSKHSDSKHDDFKQDDTQEKDSHDADPKYKDSKLIDNKHENVHSELSEKEPNQEIENPHKDQRISHEEPNKDEESKHDSKGRTVEPHDATFDSGEEIPNEFEGLDSSHNPVESRGLIDTSQKSRKEAQDETENKEAIKFEHHEEQKDDLASQKSYKKISSTIKDREEPKDLERPQEPQDSVIIPSHQEAETHNLASNIKPTSKPSSQDESKEEIDEDLNRELDQYLNPDVDLITTQKVGEHLDSEKDEEAKIQGVPQSENIEDNENISDRDSFTKAKTHKEIKDLNKHITKRTEDLKSPDSHPIISPKTMEIESPKGHEFSSSDNKMKEIKKSHTHNLEETKKANQGTTSLDYLKNQPEYLRNPSDEDIDNYFDKDRPFDSPSTRPVGLISCYEESEESKLPQNPSSSKNSKKKELSSEESKNLQEQPGQHIQRDSIATPLDIPEIQEEDNPMTTSEKEVVNSKNEEDSEPDRYSQDVIVDQKDQNLRLKDLDEDLDKYLQEEREQSLEEEKEQSLHELQSRNTEEEEKYQQIQQDIAQQKNFQERPLLHSEGSEADQEEISKRPDQEHSDTNLNQNEELKRAAKKHHSRRSALESHSKRSSIESGSKKFELERDSKRSDQNYESNKSNEDNDSQNSDKKHKGKKLDMEDASKRLSIQEESKKLDVQDRSKKPGFKHDSKKEGIEGESKRSDMEHDSKKSDSENNSKKSDQENIWRQPHDTPESDPDDREVTQKRKELSKLKRRFNKMLKSQQKRDSQSEQERSNDQAEESKEISKDEEDEFARFSTEFNQPIPKNRQEPHGGDDWMEDQDFQMNYPQTKTLKQQEDLDELFRKRISPEEIKKMHQERISEKYQQSSEDLNDFDDFDDFEEPKVDEIKMHGREAPSDLYEQDEPGIFDDKTDEQFQYEVLPDDQEDEENKETFHISPIKPEDNRAEEHKRESEDKEPDMLQPPNFIRDVTFKIKQGNADKDPNSFEYEIPGHGNRPENVFLDSGSESDEQYDNIRDKMLRRIHDEGHTGRFGLREEGGNEFPGSSQFTKPTENSKEERSAKMPNKSKTKKLKQYLSKEEKMMQPGTKGDQSHNDYTRNRVTEEIDKQYQLSKEKNKKAIQKPAFEEELREEHKHNVPSEDKLKHESSSHAFSDSKGLIPGKGNYTMNDDSFNEVNQFTNYMGEYDPKNNPEKSKDLRGPSMDSEDSYFRQFKNNLSPESYVDQQIHDKYLSKDIQRDRITNSHSAIHTPKDYQRISPENISDRKMTSESRENLYSSHFVHPHKYYDETLMSYDLEYSLLDPYEELVIDKGIMKFHPGFSINYVSRWVQVTKTVIRFYKNYYHSVCNFRRPLAVIPFSAVSKIKSVKIQPPKGANMRNFGKNPYDKHQFEIVLKEDYEALYDLNKRKREVEDLKYELELIQKLEYQNKLRSKYKKYRKKCRLSKSPVPTFKIFMQERQKDIQKLSRSHPRLSFGSKFNEDEVSRRESKMNRSHDLSRPELSIFSRGRQKDMEVSGDRSMISIDDQYIHKSCSRSKSKKKKQFKNNLATHRATFRKRCKTPFDTTMVVDGHLMPIRVNKRNGELSTARAYIKKKTKKSKKNKALWSKRETDWFKYERRFILSTKTKQEKIQWMRELRKYILK